MMKTEQKDTQQLETNQNAQQQQSQRQHQHAQLNGNSLNLVAVLLAALNFGDDLRQIAALFLVFGRHLTVAAAQGTAAIAANVSLDKMAMTSETNVLR